jgi:cytochrome c peroxidase
MINIMNNLIRSSLLCICVLTFIAACSDKNQNIEQGKILFHQVHIGKNNVIGCISCHSLNLQIQTVGPSLSGLGLRAGKLVTNMSATEYIKQSIINPDAYIVSGYAPATMFAHYKTELTDIEINSLVAFLQSLK